MPVKAMKTKSQASRSSLVESSPGESPPPAGSSLIPAALARRLIEITHPMGQASDAATGNLGYGYLYYALARMQKPETVICIGSYRGFSTVCFALALVDNGKGTCHFIDPGKVDKYWHDPQNVAELERRFGLRGHWRHLLKTSQQVVAEGAVPEPIDILLIDGDHSYQGVQFDFDHFGARVRPGGLILLHDSELRGRGFTPWEVRDFLEAEILGQSRYETFTFPLEAGLTLIRKRVARLSPNETPAMTRGSPNPPQARLTPGGGSRRPTRRRSIRRRR